MSVWQKLVDWFLGPEEDEDEGEADAVRPVRAPRPPLPDDDGESDEDVLTPEVDRALAERYGDAPADTWDAPAGGLVSRVVRYDLDGDTPHRVWVSRGLRAWRRPHELVVRVRRGEGDAPEWPRALLTALDARTRDRDRTTALGEIVRDLEVEGAPFRHFLMVPDPSLEWIEDPFSPDEGLAFVQVVPLTEERQAEMGDEIARNAVLAAWSQEDHLLLV
jgi:hypothetical protein